LEKVLASIIPGGFNLNKQLVDELYCARNFTSVLQGLIQGSYPGLTALLSSQISDSNSRLLLMRRILDEIMKNEVRRILSGYPFTIGIILAYFILKSGELKKIRTILNAKQYGRQLEQIEGLI